MSSDAPRAGGPVAKGQPSPERLGGPFKTNSSRFLRNQGIDFNWQEGYGAFAVCASHIEKVKAYIRNQREHHKKRDWE
jgi:REP element-mobilizing transposase RayT